MQPLFVPTLSHFKNKNGWSGSRGVMEYEIEEPVEDHVRVVTWYGPFSRDYAQEEKEATFPVTTDGREEMIAWITIQAKEMNESPEKNKKECYDYYLSLRDF